jgi:hypothetical protein
MLIRVRSSPSADRGEVTPAPGPTGLSKAKGGSVRAGFGTHVAPSDDAL